MYKELQYSCVKQVNSLLHFHGVINSWGPHSPSSAVFHALWLFWKCLEVRAQVSACGHCVMIPTVEGYKRCFKRFLEHKGNSLWANGPSLTLTFFFCGVPMFQRKGRLFPDTNGLFLLAENKLSWFL